MKFDNEDMILNKKVRVALIKEINGPENRNRKLEIKKRYEILKDRIKKYILDNLMEELDPETVKDMQSRIATVNLYKKVVGKKARVYRTTPKRVAEAGTDQDQLDQLADKTHLNVSMKKSNRLLEAMLNTDVFVRPIKNVHETTENGAPKWSYRIDPLSPHNYDVVEDANDEEKAMGYILSHFTEANGFLDDVDNREQGGLAGNFRDGDGVEQTIADSPNDQPKEYVWWGHKYHLTFDESGEILAKKTPEDGLNPIGVLPIVSLAKDRDGSFWAVGGEDLIEGSILVNTILSDIYYIAKMHGTGLFYLFGKGVPKSYKVGPNNAITMDVKEGDPTPTIGFANANPQLAEHMKLVEQYVAILLTTNDLEPGSVQGQLSATGASSGIQEMIIKSEPMGSVEDDQEIFKDAEPKVVNVCAKWHNLYLDKGLLVEDLAEMGKMPDKLEYSIKFGAVQQFMSETEKLDVIEKRMDLSIDTLVDAMILDNPDMSAIDAKKKIEENERFNLERSQTALAQMIKEDDANKEDKDKLQLKSGEGTSGDESNGEDES
jgi:hypothetical protein